MYRGGAICLTLHFKPLWSKNAPHFGVAHALCLGLAPWLAAEVRGFRGREREREGKRKRGKERGGERKREKLAPRIFFEPLFFFFPLSFNKKTPTHFFSETQVPHLVAEGVVEPKG